MLTNKAKYGLKALLHLATLPSGESALGAKIAVENAIPKKFLDTILLDLRNAGLVRTKKGPGGGYALRRSPSDIKVGDIVRALDGPLAPIGCASRNAYSPCIDCAEPKSCAVRIAMMRVRDATAEVLDNLTLAQMADFGDGQRQVALCI
ncbi:MAG: Rrf2 family transcriptional regulator [Chitinophagales bacterium]|nr:Rrf2 family transcriptional regulator [Hyphomicrobiales bacterium]